jgi:hypothetical protein
MVVVFLAACGSSSGSKPGDGNGGPTADGPMLGTCPILPANHIFNTPIDNLPVDPNSDAYITTISPTRKLHLDLGTQTDQQADDFYGIPWNTMHGATDTWSDVAYLSTDPGLDWDATAESDCGDASHATVRPCTASAPILPIPQSPIVEGGINTSSDQMPYGDHHLLVVDVDACKLWEMFHVYSPSAGVWNIYGSAEFDLTSTALRPAVWTSADAAGFPIMPLLLKADEASTGTIHHALRFTIGSSKIRTSYVWPARHLTDNGTNSTSLPPMGQLFRLKASYQIPVDFDIQSKAILQAMKTYGMYIADGGSDWYISGEPSANWHDAVFTEVQSVTGDQFEAVDITAITSRAGFDPDSAAVP